MIIDGPDALRQWLTKTLEPICDADPAALAKYVMALLKKDKPESELEEFCVDQLDVFLQKETKGFVEKLFVALRSKSYLSSKAESSPGETAAEPLKPSQPSADTSLSSNATAKSEETVVSSTGAEDDGNKAKSVGGESSSSRRRRISPPPRDERERRSPRDRLRDRDHRLLRSRSRSRSRDRDRRELSRRGGAQTSGGSRGRAERSERRERDTRERRRSLDRTRSRSRSRSPYARSAKTKDLKDETPSPDKKPKKTRCRDYDEKGYCMRGDLCPFDHGPDPVVVDDTALEKMVNIGSGGKTSSSGSAIPLPNFSVPPPGYTPLNPPPPGVEASTAYVPLSVSSSSSKAAEAVSSSAVEPYNPEAPALTDSSLKPNVAVPPPGFTAPPPPIPSLVGSAPWVPTPYSVAGAPGALRSVIVSGLAGNNYSLSGGGQPLSEGGGYVGGRLVGRLGPMPGRGGRYPGAIDRQNKTLEVRKIPPSLNNISKLNEHFCQFGQITNIQVRYNGDSEAALITYAVRHQAMTAYKSTAPILNNRFIKVFWHGCGPGDDGGSGIDTRPGIHYSGGETNLASIKDRLGTPATTEEEKAIVYNTKRKSLTKTVYNPEALKAAAGKQKFTAKKQQQPLAVKQSQKALQQARMAQMKYQRPTKANGANQPSVAHPHMETYVETRKRRKIEKDKKMTFIQLHKKKSDLLAKQVEQQKLLLTRMSKVTDAGKKKQMYKIFKTVDDSIKNLRAEMEDITKKLVALNAASDVAEKAAADASEGGRTKAAVEKETLDVELELLSQQQVGGDTAHLKQRLDDLKQELIMARNGESDQPMTSTPLQNSFVGERKSSGGGNIAPAKKPRAVKSHAATLDKRPKRLIVSGFNDDQRDPVIDHLQQFGDLEDLEFEHKNGETRAIVVYKTRVDAEQALSLAGDFPACELTLQWATQVKAAAPVSGTEDGRKLSQSSDVIPDEERAPDQRVTPAALLASIGDVESDDSDREERRMDLMDEHEIDDEAFAEV